MEIKVIKLINGDELVGKVQEKMAGIADAILVSKPRQMIVQNTKNGPVSGLIPWILSAPDCDVYLTPDKFFAISNVSKEVEDYYLEVTSSIALS
jgi:hypothetical protein